MKEEKQAQNINTLISEKSIKHNTHVRILESRLFSLNQFIAQKRENSDFTNEVRDLKSEQMEILGKLRKLDKSYTLNVNNGPVYFNQDKQFNPSTFNYSPTNFIDRNTFGYYNGCLEISRGLGQEGTSIVPSGSGSTGEIVKSGSGFRGRLADNDDTPPEDAKRWLKNWKQIISFPPSFNRLVAKL